MRRAVAVLAVMGVLAALGDSGVAQAKPPASVPVTITIKSKTVTPYGCPELCITFFGAVHSPKPSCARSRTLSSDIRVRYRGETKTYHGDYFGETDAQGKWEVLQAMLDGQRIIWLVVRLPKERIGGVTCQAASAKVTL